MAFGVDVEEEDESSDGGSQDAARVPAVNGAGAGPQLKRQARREKRPSYPVLPSLAFF